MRRLTSLAGEAFWESASGEQLADYLGVERTALSKELGKMKREGLLDYHKNMFRIYIDVNRDKG